MQHQGITEPVILGKAKRIMGQDLFNNIFFESTDPDRQKPIIPFEVERAFRMACLRELCKQLRKSRRTLSESKRAVLLSLFSLLSLARLAQCLSRK